MLRRVYSDFKESGEHAATAEGEEAILSQRERSDFTSIVHSSARRGPFDLKTQRTHSWRLPLDGDSSWPARRCDFVSLFDDAQKQLPWKYTPTSTVNNLTKNGPFGLHYSLI